MATHFHQTWTSGKLVEVNKSRPIYWCPIWPMNAWSTGGLHFEYESEEVPIQRGGWGELKGYYIDNIRELNGNLNSLTPQQVWDDYVPKVDAPNFDVGTSFDDDDRFQSGIEYEQGDEGHDEGEDNVQENTLLSHPKVFQQIDWLGFGPTCIYQKQVPLGVASGRGMPVTDQTQRYVWNETIQHGMVGGGSGKIGVIIFGISIPELGASDDGRADTMTERLSPWTHWTTGVKAQLEAERNFTEALLTMDQGDLPEEFRELMDWKRTYSVGDDTWQNTNGKYRLRGSATMTSSLSEHRRHI